MKRKNAIALFLFVFGSILLLTSVAYGDWPLPPQQTGFLYLAGQSSNNVGEYSVNQATGALTFIRAFQPPSPAQTPQGIAVDSNGNLAIAAQPSVVRLDLNGNPLAGVSHADLTEPSGIARSPNGKWYVGNYLPGRVLVFGPTWNYLTTIQPVGMDGVNAIAFDVNGSFAVTAGLANKVYRFNANNTLIGTVTTPNMQGPMGIAVDSQGNHYVANANGNSITKFSPSWAPLFTFTTGTISGPQDVIIDEHDILLVTAFLSPSTQRFDTQGIPLGPATVMVGVSSARSGAFQTNGFPPICSLPAPQCSNQQGVCAGSTQQCVAGSYAACSVATYSAYSSLYQQTESFCDNYDNDCDGQVDEGCVPNAPSGLQASLN